MLASRLHSAAANNLVRLREEVLFRFIHASPAQTGSPRVLFCPSEGKTGASLLRAYNMADALQAYGWVSVCIPNVIKPGQRERLIRRFQPDLLVFQQCRHALNDIAYSFDYPVVLDTDDADFHLTIPGLHERLDRTSRGARGVIAGSRYLADWHAERCPATQVIWTGTPASRTPRVLHEARAPIVAWAQAKPLSYTEELAFVIALDRRLRQAGADYTLRFYGIGSAQEEASLRSQFENADHVEVLPPLEYDVFLGSLQDVAVGLAPLINTSEFSRGKSFGKVLGYLDAKVPVIASDEADHALFFTPECGVVSNNMDVWETSALELLADAERRETMAQAAFSRFEQKLSLNAAAHRTDRFMRTLL